jgi:hypothetical protein
MFPCFLFLPKIIRILSANFVVNCDTRSPRDSTVCPFLVLPRSVASEKDKQQKSTSSHRIAVAYKKQTQKNKEEEKKKRAETDFLPII